MEGRVGSIQGPIQAGKEPGRPGAPRESSCAVGSSPEPWAGTAPVVPQAQVIAQAIGQAFGVAYQRFLEANSIDPSELSPRQYSRALEDQEQYNAELTHFSRQENCKDVRAAPGGGDSLETPLAPLCHPLRGSLSS